MSSNKKVRKHFLLLVFFLMAVCFFPTTARAKVRIKNPYKTPEQLAKTKGNATEKGIWKRLLQGKIGYVGTQKDCEKMEKRLKKVYGFDMCSLNNMAANEDDLYYKELIDTPYKDCTANDIYAVRDCRAGKYYDYITIDKTAYKNAVKRKKFWKHTMKALKKAGVKNGMSNKKAYKKIAKWMIKHTRYKIVKVRNAEDCKLYTKGRGQCCDYSHAIWAMCKAANIPCQEWYGLCMGVYHAWNRVKLGGKWYWSDVCMADKCDLSDNILFKMKKIGGYHQYIGGGGSYMVWSKPCKNNIYSIETIDPEYQSKALFLYYLNGGK